MNPALSTGEALLSLPAVVPPVSAVRGTLLVSSQAALREAGHYERYLELLNAGMREEVQCVIASTWVDMDLASAHYAACEALALTSDEIVTLGERVGDRIQGAFMVTLTRALRGAGVTPWALLGQFDRLWGRLMQGGGVEVWREGPKDARVVIRGLPLLRNDYFRNAFVGVFNVGFRLVASPRYFVRVRSLDSATLACTYSAQWV